ncbi:DUF350 domain-containing protein [Vibrio sp. D431a]|uniref:DUF350 domain-containing protein n=1 Tax=Vibrio sp. D431a TaxID=2837388 RepID=UPI00255242F9|nr:DUF350 domain-containing protein [Vibrio sp. D431a]MDK9789804.1 DUF350 domain-containing protein [Vibrio sp. D431a]
MNITLKQVIFGTDYSFTETLLSFGLSMVYFAISLIMLGLFYAIYSRVTPYCEKTLIRKNNKAAAISLAGALVGVVLPIAAAQLNALSLLDFVFWGVASIVTQVIAFILVSIAFPKKVERINDGQEAMGITLAGISLVVGILLAASITY